MFVSVRTQKAPKSARETSAATQKAQEREKAGGNYHTPPARGDPDAKLDKEIEKAMSRKTKAL